MRTEITIPFAFDTAPIEQMLEGIGEDEVRAKVDEIISERVDRNVPKKSNGFSSTPYTDWKAFIENRMYAWLDSHAQEIVDEAALLLAQRGTRRATWRTVLAEIKEQEAEDDR